MTQQLALLGVPDSEASEALTTEGFWAASVAVVGFWVKVLSSDFVLLTCVFLRQPQRSNDHSSKHSERLLGVCESDRGKLLGCYHLPSCSLVGIRP